MAQNTPSAPTLTLSFTSDATGAGKVFSFGTTGSVSQGPIAGFPTGGFTWTCWFQTSDTNTAAVLWSYGTDDAHRIWIENPANIAVRYGATGTTGGTGVAVNDGQPHYLALSIFPTDATHYGVALYLDGMPVYQGLGALAYTAGGGLQDGGTLVLGRSVVTGAAASLQGTASQFRLWNLVRTSVQIVDDMQVRAPLDGSTPMITWALTSAATSGTVNPPGTFADSATPSYRTENFLASWTSAGAGATYELLVQAVGGSWQRDYTNLTATSQAITGYSINMLYSAMVRATVGGETSPWSTAQTARTLNLGPIDATLTSSGQQNLQAGWPAVDQAQGYLVQLFKNGGTTADSSATQPGTSYDLMTLAQGTDWWNYSIRAASQGAFGPANPQAALTPVALAFGYYNDGTAPAALKATWAAQANAQFFYLVINKTNAPASSTGVVLSGSTTSYTIATGLNEGDTYTAQIRPIGIGTVGQWSPLQTVVIHNLVAPTITGTSSDGAAHTVTFGWQFNAGSLTPAYTTQLFTYGASTPLDTDPNSSSPKTFQNAAIVDGTNFQVRVQARADNSYGRWSALTTVAVGLPPQVTAVQANVDVHGNISVTWATSDQPVGVTYNINLNGPGVDITHNGLSGPPYTYAYSDTNVQTGQTYAVSVWAVENGRTGLPGTSDVTIGQITPVDPNNQGNNGWVMDPVSVANGMYSYENLDIQVPDIFPLQLTTSYSTTTPSSAESPFYNGKPLGERWNHTYNARIARDGANTELYVLWGTGQTDTFLIPASITGTYQQKGVPTGTSLTVTADLTITVTNHNQMQYIFTFDGRLTKIYSAIGNSQTLSYNGPGQLTRVTADQSGRYIDMAYTPDGHLQTATDNSGRQVHYAVTGGNLISATDVNGNARTFSYTGASLIQTITDQNNQPMLKNTYTDSRVTFQQNARALVAGQPWGTALAYAETTVNGIDMIQTTVTDPEGNITVYISVKANGNQMSAQALLPGGQMRLTTATYDGFNNLTSQTLYQGPIAGYVAGNGNTTIYSYDANNNPASRTNPLGQIERFTFDAQNNLRSYTDTLGNTQTWQFTGNGFAGNLLRNTTDALGRTTAFTYKPGTIAGLYDTITDVLGNITRYTWNGVDMQQATNPLGGTTLMHSDSIGRVMEMEVHAAAGTLLQTMMLTYEASGQVKTSTVQVPGQPLAQAYVTTNQYDGNGNRTSLADAVGQSFAFHYDPNNLLIEIDYPAFRGTARTSLYAYDMLDNIMSITLAAGVADKFTVNQFGETVSYTDPNNDLYTIGREMVIAGAGPYPQRNTLTYPELSVPGQMFTEITTLNAAGLMTAVTNRAGDTTAYAYSAQSAGGGRANLVITTTMPPASQGDDPLQTIAVYDPLGRMISATNAAGATTTVAYTVVPDPASGTNQEVATITDPLGNMTVRTRDALGRVVAMWWGKGPVFRTRSFTYDMLNRLQSCTEGDGATSAVTAYTYGYDAPTNRVTASIGRPGDAAAATVLAYDGLSQLLTETDAVGNRATLAYAPWGAVAGFTNGDGNALTYDYDAAGRFYQINLPNGAGVITHILDANGNRLQTKRDSTVSIARTFDQWNRLLTRTSNGATVGYDYTPIDLVSTLTYSDQQKVTYGYNALAQLESVTDWSARATRYGYFPSGMVESIANANGTTCAFTFDTANRLTGFTQKSGAAIIAQANYTLDALGNRTAASEIFPMPFTAPPYSGAAKFNPANEMTMLNGTALTSDLNGNLQGIPVDGVMETAAYDWFQQLIKFGGDNFEYDEDGLRTRTTISGDVLRYVHDVNSYQAPWQQMPAANMRVADAVMAPTILGGGAQMPGIGAAADIVQLNNALDRVLEVTDDSGSIQHRFVYGLGLISQESADSGYRVFHFDSRGSTLASTSASGAVLGKHAYSPYGALLASQDTASYAPFLYNGRDGVMDDGNGLYYMRARNYSPVMGRFMQRDYLFGSLSSPQTLNRYSYVAGNPISNIDPLGLKGVRDTLIALGTIGGAAALGAAIYFGLPAIGTGIAAIGGGIAGLGGAMIEAQTALTAAGNTGTLARTLLQAGARFRTWGQALQRLGQAVRALRPPPGYQQVLQVEVELEMQPIGAVVEAGAGGGDAFVAAEATFDESASLLTSESSLASSGSEAEIEMQTLSSSRVAEPAEASQTWNSSRSATSTLRQRTGFNIDNSQ